MSQATCSNPAEGLIPQTRPALPAPRRALSAARHGAERAARARAAGTRCTRSACRCRARRWPHSARRSRAALPSCLSAPHPSARAHPPARPRVPQRRSATERARRGGRLESFYWWGARLLLGDAALTEPFVKAAPPPVPRRARCTRPGRLHGPLSRCPCSSRQVGQWDAFRLTAAVGGSAALPTAAAALEAVEAWAEARAADGVGAGAGAGTAPGQLYGWTEMMIVPGNGSKRFIYFTLFF